jgi:hypothetical protein
MKEFLWGHGKSISLAIYIPNKAIYGFEIRAGKVWEGKIKRMRILHDCVRLGYAGRSIIFL